MKIGNKNIIHTAKILGACLIALSAIGFVEKKHQKKRSLDLEITIANQMDNFFVSEEDIQILISDGTAPLLGENVPGHVLHEMEQRLVSHKFIESAQVYKNLKGKLVVQVIQSTPVARLLRADKPDAYITMEGNVLPTSEKFTARVPLISGAFTDRMILEGAQITPEGQKVLDIINYINGSDFWSAQIAQLDVSERGEITMYTQIGKQYIEFGNADNLVSKFQRLDLFYKKILPEKGWNVYSRVNVQYRDQIICE